MKRVDFNVVRKGKKTHKRARPGFMYTFRYDAEAEFYDMYPLIIALKMPFNNVYFTGLNIHYLRPDIREFFLANFVEKFGKGPEGGDFLIPSTIHLESFRKLQHWRHCIKNYNYDRINSSLHIIPPDEWEETSKIFYERFIGIRYTQLWERTKRIRN